MDRTQESELSRPLNRGGCRTCRKRHLKCDQAEPVCHRCLTSGLDCGGFASALRWVVSTGSEINDKTSQQENNEDQHSRRQLYSEESREFMCTVLAAKLSSTVVAALNQIDDQARIFESETETSLSIGPFGVFKVTPDVIDVGLPNRAIVDSANKNLDASLPAGPSIPTFTTPDYNISEPLDFLQWADLFDWGPDLLANGPSTQSSIFPQAPGVVGGESLQSRDEGVSDTRELYHGNHRSIGYESSNYSQWPDIDLLVDAPLLLQHFIDEVIDQMGSLPIYAKSPWTILNTPTAILTLSELTLFSRDREKIKHGNLANFYGLIAVSSFHVSLNFAAFPDIPRVPRIGDDWTSVSRNAYRAAKYHMNLSLERESFAPGHVKYKEQLMAINAILATAILSGSERDVRHYLTEMERLIRQRGLTKKTISRRARLLHQIYAWIRIVSESTYVLHEQREPNEVDERDLSFRGTRGDTEIDGQAQSSQALPQMVQAGHDFTLDDFLGLEPRLTDYERVIHGEHSSGSSIRDIHLADSQQYRDNMCLQVYGVPETWLSLVSQTTRLANVIDHLNTDRTNSESDILASLQPKIARLEDAICTFVSRNQSDPHSSSATAKMHATKPHTHMLHALNSALIIFFYRRIRNVNPWILRHSVDEVINYLHMFDAALEQNGLLGPGTAWAAFISGAEATMSNQRETIIQWLDVAFSKSGFVSYRLSKEVLAEIWKRYDEGRSEVSGTDKSRTSRVATSATWMEVCKKMQCWPLLC